VSLPSEPRNSKAWYLIPIFLGIVGGIIMFVILRQENRDMAKNGMILGVVMTVVWIVPWIAGSVIFPETRDMTFEEGFQYGYEQGYESTAGTGTQDYVDERVYEPAVVETPQRAQNCSLFCDSTGYEPAWAKNMGQMQANMKCASIDDYDSPDLDWCMEFLGYMLDNLN